jgi:hypothetical protein
MARSKEQYERSVAIAKDYYFSTMTLAEIAEKHGCKYNNISSIARKFNMHDLLQPKEQQPMDVLMFDPEFTAIAIELLNEYNVKFHAPKRYTIEVEIESSLNY